MDNTEKSNSLEEAVEILAAFEHERWAHWQRYMHSKGKLRDDGSLLIPASFVERWERQIATPYVGLTENEKESDREQVRRYISVIMNVLQKQ